MPNRVVIMAIVLALTGVIATTDYFVTQDAAIWLVYIVPIGLCAWYFKRWVTICLCLVISILCILFSPFPCPHYNPYSEVARNIVPPHWCFQYITGACYHVIFYTLLGLLISHMREQRESIERLGWESLTDSLTGLFNRRYLQSKLKEEKARSDRYKRPLAVLMADIDEFKAHNDAHGHAKGDEVLAKIGQLLHRRVREIDVVCRYGGEEFLVLLPETNGAGAQIVAERLRAGVEEARLGGTAPLTISIGIAIYPQDARSPELAIVEADSALYKAKQAGRNRICSAQEPAEKGPSGAKNG